LEVPHMITLQSPCLYLSCTAYLIYTGGNAIICPGKALQQWKKGKMNSCS
jgi:hypothetical protein